MLQAEVAEVRGGNALGRAAAAQRSERHAEIIASIRAGHRVPPYVDLEALVELLSAALTLFALRTAAHGSAEQSARSLEPDTPQGWRRIEKTIGMVARALLESS